MYIIIIVQVEICLVSTSTARPSDIRDRTVALLEKTYRGKYYTPGNITPLCKSDKEYLAKHIHHGRICEIIAPDAMVTSASSSSSSSSSSSGNGVRSIYLPSVNFWQAKLQVYVFQLNEDGPSNEGAGGDEGNGGGETDVVSQYTQWNLPAVEFEGTWEALIYDDDDAHSSTDIIPNGTKDQLHSLSSSSASAMDIIPSSSSSTSSSSASPTTKRTRSSEDNKNTNNFVSANHPSTQIIEDTATSSLAGSRLKPALLQYASSALLFSDAGVDTSLITWNHVLLLHGPPGTGKTSLCKALAHKLSIRLSDRYPTAQLIEINAHSLFSRWFSESGKLVHRLFAHIGELVADEDSLIFLLIDEVESLTSARKAAVSGSEPSDAVRVVNAVLTAIDSFRTRKNVLLLTTSNVSEAIDVAFVDRADIKAFVGPPGTLARYDVLGSCVNELIRVGLIKPTIDNNTGTVQRLAAGHEIKNILSTGTAPPPSESNGSIIDIPASKSLWLAAEAAENFSGRTLRKLPLQAHAMYVRSSSVSPSEFTNALFRGVQAEKHARKGFADA